MSEQMFDTKVAILILDDLEMRQKLGETVAQAFVRMYFLERACEAQVLMLSAGRDGLNNPHQAVAQKVESQSTGDTMTMVADRLSWPEPLRQLNRIDPSFRD